MSDGSLALLSDMISGATSAAGMSTPAALSSSPSGLSSADGVEYDCVDGAGAQWTEKEDFPKSMKSISLEWRAGSS